ncbi:MAG: hypothetical protein GY906_30095 [bacterium]|nr:hypothetical protein [bacterium]
MAVSPSFTPQQVINTARLRHPGLTTLVLDDPELVEDYNQATRLLHTAIVKTKPEAMMNQTADLAVVGADGSKIDLEFPEGELVGIPTALEAVQGGNRVRVLLRTNIEHREAMARELIDDGRPGGIIIRNNTNNRWELFEIINWATVTAIAGYATFYPVTVGVGDLNVEVLLPFILFGPLVEEMALMLAHRADLGGEWLSQQQAVIQSSLEGALLEFAL